MEATVVLTLKNFVVSVALGGVVGLFLHIYKALVLNPRRLRSKLVKQGIKGPPPSLLFGNVSEVKRIQLPRTYTTMSGFPFSFHTWTSGGKNMLCLLCLSLRLIYMLNIPNFLHMNSEF